jgi:hypothetical protein
MILFRARPIIDIVTSVTGKLTQIDPNAEGCADDPYTKLVCFSFNACFKFNTTLRSASASLLRLHYRIEAETYTGIQKIVILMIIFKIDIFSKSYSGKKYYRVKFKSSADTDNPNIIERDITIRGLFLKALINKFLSFTISLNLFYQCLGANDLQSDHCSKEIVYLKDKSDIQNPVYIFIPIKHISIKLN